MKRLKHVIVDFLLKRTNKGKKKNVPFDFPIGSPIIGKKWPILQFQVETRLKLTLF